MPRRPGPDPAIDLPFVEYQMPSAPFCGLALIGVPMLFLFAIVLMIRHGLVKQTFTVLLTTAPFIPRGKENMIGWMAGKSDPEEYGELIVYELPKDKLIYGPNQVESRIDQSPEISEQLTLWDQSGSRVIRGNLIVVPIEDSFLYVEPVFLIAEGIQLPQMRRVIVSYGERVAMEPSLEEGLNALFGTSFIQPRGEPGQPTRFPVEAARRPSLDLFEAEEARQALSRAEEALREGDLEAFGREFEAIREAIEALPEPRTETPVRAPDTSAVQ